MATEVYSYTTHFINDYLNIAQLRGELLEDATIGSKIKYVKNRGDVVTVYLLSTLSGQPEKDILDAIVTAHAPKAGATVPPGSQNLNMTEFGPINAPDDPPINSGRLYKKDGDDGIFWKTIGGGEIDLSAHTTLPTTTKGDLMVHNGTVNIRLPVGVNGKVLTANSNAVGGIDWDDAEDADNDINIFYTEDDVVSSTTSKNYQQHLRLTFTSDATEYLINWSAEILSTKAGVTVKIRALLDDVITINETAWPTEIGNSKSHSTNSSGSESDEPYIVATGFQKVILTAGQHTVDIEYCAGSNKKKVKIRRARIYVMKVTDIP